ncbi:methyltransferase domain-containing protein [Rhodopirellula sp. JC740]|uniref:Methyltransferase domain-containing protein n=1 Tax=Rhodopirellula halodulae TaxID=2894198 RepID=A0ABS8NEH0_9BACT|nr:methyltransferase domain-containing protein [Rhodopirellula sp. JC740]MCC9641946.1 methyltransferase domain-containing protein [Rhodopirellula sp. JC740]
MRSAFLIAISIVALLQTSPAFTQDAGTKDLARPAQNQSVNPGINDSFLDPELDVDAWLQRFEVESREVYAAKDEIVAAFGLQSGDRVADIGTGTGLYVEPFCDAVGTDGWVYAIDIAPKFVQRVSRIAEHKRLDNVTPVLGSGNDICLPPASIDAAFVCDVYHHFEFPSQSLQSIHRAMKPGGQLVVIDFERIEGVSREWTMGHVRAGKDVFRKEIEAAGFEFVEEVKLEGFKENYFLRFRRP